MNTFVDQTVDAYLIVSASLACAVSVQLRYSPLDPFAVHVTFPAQFSAGGTAAEWVFSRSILEEGIRVPAGEGNVRFHPCGPLRIGAEFHGTGGVARLQFSGMQLRRFLRNAYAAIPYGSEHELLDLDRELDALLKDGGDGAIASTS